MSTSGNIKEISRKILTKWLVLLVIKTIERLGKLSKKAKSILIL